MAIKTEKTAKEQPALAIRTVPGCKSFCRAGLRFGEAPTLIHLDCLSKEQVKALKDEKKLVVEEVTVSLADVAE